MTDQKLTLVPPSSATELPDPWDVESLRVDQDFEKAAGVKKLLVKIPVRPPSPDKFIRVHPTFRNTFPVIRLKDEGEYYIVDKPLVPDLANEVMFVTMFTAVDRAGNVFQWPIPLERDGKKQEWWRSAREAAEIAIGQWVRVKANKGIQGYDIIAATGIMTDPVWPPDATYSDILRIAFRSYRISSLDHPVIRELLGQ
jgi:hypothetical protein